MLKNKLYWALALCLLTAAAPPQDATPTVFGMTLGKPLSIPKCRHKVYPDGRVSELIYEDDPSQTCYEPDIQLSDAPWRRGGLTFPLGRSPLIMRGNSGYTIILDGKLEGIEIETLDHNNTGAIMSELIAKFGKPTEFESYEEVVQGIAVPARLAIWRNSAVTVEYRNIYLHMGTGYLRIMTPRYERLRLNHQREQAAGRTRL